MKQDIRDLFQSDIGDSKNKLPESHRDEFSKKLKASRSSKVKSVNYFYIFKLAAMLVLFIAIGFFVFKISDSPKEKVVATSTIELQIKKVEKEYLNSIDKEWESFIALTEDEQLVKRYKSKLADLDNDYKLIASKFKQDTNNIYVIEELVNNLQMRLQLLKDIQAHIKLLNQENEHHETTNI